MSETPDQKLLKPPVPSRTANRQARPVLMGAPTLYVGIGASAGGLAVLQTFFDRMQVDSGAAFIVVLHLSPDYDSHMDKLLASHTSMSVQFAAHGMEVAANSVYIIPPKSNLSIKSGTLYLEKQIRDGSLTLPIDFFFQTLAEDARHRSVGVILSGSGSDGSRGIKQIKKAGGLVLVQDCHSAQFDSMPYVASLTGTADLILPPVELTDHLSMFLSSSMVRTTAMLSLPRVDPEDPALAELFHLLNSNSGIDFSLYESRSVRQRIGRRMDIQQSTQLSDYLQVLQRSSTEQSILVRDLLLPISSFFDDPALWNYLSDEVLTPLIRAADAQQGLRLWVIGCATGEEAYSLAMVMDAAMRRCKQLMPVKIFATDIDKSSLEIAVAAEYGKEIAPDVPGDGLLNYFAHRDDNYTVRPEIRSSVLFAIHDLVNDAPYPSIDLILCRKVLQYFERHVQIEALSAIQQSLRDDGSLILGASDPAHELNGGFRSVNEPLRHYSKVPDSGDSRQKVSHSDPITAHLNRMKSGMPVVSQAGNRNRCDFVKDRLIARHVSACIILDAEEQIVQLHSRASDYLTRHSSGAAAANVHHLISLQLRDSLSSAILRAKTTSEVVRCIHLPYTHAGRSTHLTLTVHYHRSRKLEDTFFSIVIVDESPAGARVAEASSIDMSEQARQHISMLEKKLLHGEDNLHQLNKALADSCKLLESSGGKLTTANDELQRVNEQLRLVNKQLSAINSIHEEKITDLTVIAAASDYALNAISIALVILDNELKIRKYTTESTKYFHLVQADLGKSLPDIANELDYESLADDITTTHKTHQSRSRTVETQDGHWVKVDILPYHSSRPEASLHSAVTVKLTPARHHLPIQNAAQQPGAFDRSISLLQPPQVMPNVRVLVVDDNKVDRYRIAHNLNKILLISIDIFEAHDVASALDSLKKNDISVCLIDYRLCHETAHDLANCISEFNTALPLILMSGSRRDQLADKVPAPLLDYYLNKDNLSPLLLELSIRHAISTGSEMMPQLLRPTSIKN